MHPSELHSSMHPSTAGGWGPQLTDAALQVFTSSWPLPLPAPCFLHLPPWLEDVMDQPWQKHLHHALRELWQPR